jgi:hypothetical protein
MAALAKDRNLRNGSITTAGTVNAQTFTSGLLYTVIPSGLRVLLKIGPALTNTGPMTLNMDGIAATSVKDMTGNDLGAGVVKAGGYQEFIYSGTNWVLLGTGSGVGGTGGTGITIIDRTTIISQSTSDFVTGITADHDEYVFSGAIIVPQVDDDTFYLQISEDHGATWKSGATDYKWAGFNVTDTALFAGEGSGDTDGSDSIIISTNIKSDPTAGINFNIRLYNPADTSHVTFFEINTSYFATPGIMARWMGSGMYVNVTPINAVRFAMLGGNIASGTIRLYGIEK